MRSFRRSPALLLLPVLLGTVALVAAACGGSDGDKLVVCGRFFTGWRDLRDAVEDFQ